MAYIQGAQLFFAVVAFFGTQFHYDGIGIYAIFRGTTDLEYANGTLIVANGWNIDRVDLQAGTVRSLKGHGWATGGDV